MDGRIFYTSERVGQYGKPFMMVKFRTMVKGAEKYFPILLRQHGINGSFTFPNDDRITKLGKILRETHFDELPQIYNISRGEMSLVGVRAKRSEVWDLYPKEHVRNVLTQKPGLCGIEYYYSNLRDMQDIMQAHVEYTRQKEANPEFTDKKYFKGIIKNRARDIFLEPAHDKLLLLTQLF